MFNNIIIYKLIIFFNMKYYFTINITILSYDNELV